MNICIKNSNYSIGFTYTKYFTYLTTLLYVLQLRTLSFNMLRWQWFSSFLFKIILPSYGFIYMAGFDRFEVFALVLWCLSFATSLLNTSTSTHTSIVLLLLECQMIKGIPTQTTSHWTVNLFMYWTFFFCVVIYFGWKLKWGLLKFSDGVLRCN